MVNFESDYIAGAHPKLMQRLLETNLEPGAGYGDDRGLRSGRFWTSAAAPTAPSFSSAAGPRSTWWRSPPCFDPGRAW